MLVGAFCALFALAITALEALDATTCIYELLLARKEGMALIAKLTTQLVNGRAGLKDVATRTRHTGDFIRGVDLGLHSDGKSMGRY